MHRSFLCLACFKDLLLHGGGSRKRLQSCGHWLTVSISFLAACMWMRFRRVLSLHDISDSRPVRRCSGCRLSDHNFRRCQIAADPDIFCGCTLNPCGKCSAACPVCDDQGHAADTLKENVRRGIVPKWACSLHNMQDMHVRMAPGLKNVGPTQRVRKEVARGNKRRLAELVPKDGTRFRTHAVQFIIVDLTGLGGAAAAPAVRTSNGVAAALQDDVVPRPAARLLGAFTADSAAQRGEGSSEPFPGALASVDVASRLANVVAALRDQLKKQPKYSGATRGAMRRRENEVGLGGAGSGAEAEVLGLASPSFKVKGKDLKRAAVRYVGLPDGAVDAVKVKDALAAFLGPGQMFTGGSVTNQTLSRDFVCRKLMKCAASVQLSVPAVLASMRQFIVEMRAGDEDMRWFFKDLDTKLDAPAVSL